MSTPELDSLLAAEESRRKAMLGADTAGLQLLLADTLVYTHSTGARDNRQSWLLQLSSGALVYEKLEFRALEARVSGPVGLINANMHATVLRAGTRREVASSYLAVWIWVADSGWQLQAVQATALPVTIQT